MTDDPRPSDKTPPSIPPLVDWMSRHGWKVLVGLVVIELLFHAYAVGAQSSGTVVGSRPATVRVQFDVVPLPE